MIIVIANPKGGAGKTTTALNLAALLVSVDVIDLDLHESISVLDALRVANGKESLSVSVAKNEMELINLIQGSEKYHVLIDCGGFDSDLISVAIAAADIVICPSSDDVTELNALRIFNDVLMRISENVDRKITAYVCANKVHHARRDFSEFTNWIDNFNHLDFLDYPIISSKSIKVASKSGLAVSELNINDKASKCYSKLIKAVLKHEKK